MVTVYRGQNWKLAVYGRDHGVPHFHIEGPGYRRSIAIESGALIVGTAPAAVNRVTLMRVWSELNG